MGKGLPCRFFLQDGRFQLASGTQKAKDAIWFYCIFDKFRIYTSDFGANFHTLVQRSVAFLFANRNLILGNLRRGITIHNNPHSQIATLQNNIRMFIYCKGECIQHIRTLFKCDGIRNALLNIHILVKRRGTI
jgi:hypothetical protein